FVSSAFY
ncbi:Glycogen debranching enzyme, partial [Haemophilus influenzae]